MNIKNYLLFAKAMIKNRLFLCFIVAITWQLLYVCIGFVSDNFFPHLIYATQPHTIDVLTTQPLSHHLANWDSVWYLNIAEKTYTWNEFSPAFYPLYPMLIKLVHLITFGAIGFVGSALIVNTLALTFVLAALMNIGLHLFGKKKELYVILAVIFLASPAAVFLHLIYTEAVFCAIAFWAYYFALKSKWIPMSILLGLLTATRITAVLVIGLCLLEYLRLHQWNIRYALNKNILWFLLIPVGFISYVLLLKFNIGDPLAMFHAYGSNSWSYHKFNPNILHTIWNEVHEVLHVVKNIGSKQNLQGFYFDLFIMNTLLPLIALGIIFISSLYSIFKIKSWGIPLGIYGLLSIVMFTLNSNLVSVHRYALPVITIYIAGVHFASRFRWGVLTLLFTLPAAAVIQGILFVLFSRNVFIG